MKPWSSEEPTGYVVNIIDGLNKQLQVNIYECDADV